jgi:hypothetical protein
MMPRVNGYEVCQILKENPKTKAIPVIFLTALSHQEALRKAAEGGAEILAVIHHEKPGTGGWNRGELDPFLEPFQLCCPCALCCLYAGLYRFCGTAHWASSAQDPADVNAGQNLSLINVFRSHPRLVFTSF